MSVQYVLNFIHQMKNDEKGRRAKTKIPDDANLGSIVPLAKVLGFEFLLE